LMKGRAVTLLKEQTMDSFSKLLGLI